MALAAAAVVIAIGVFLAVRGVGGGGSEARTALPLDEATIQFIRPTAVGMQGGERQWELTADRMSERDGKVYLDVIEPGLLYRDGEPYLTFSAQAGVWDQATDVLELTGNVRVFRDGEPLLESDKLVWDGRREILTSPGPVRIHHEGTTIRADTMIGYVKKDELVFRGNVQVLGERVTLTSLGELVYRVEDGSMRGLGPGRLQLNVSRADEKEE